LSAAELEGMGFKVALFPGSGFLSAAAALHAVYTHMKQAGIGTGGPALFPFPEMNRVMGFPAVHAFEAKWREPAA
jgi:2-methylisocitrate lyase-like PEP mutase family enzyme